ncbi:MAG: hypothetical protein HKUEN01_33770 [Candidatus Kuenenia stuttgartiensis]|uniref:class I SAM-dependent methyltransferase n=1 Tax=Kuenenia stuttgartiensis TaxID=174633 RepID=UPI00146DB8CC|nr:class I SAM-dependent methyltransferase [Candidatus Kuenenia stuttgartiensis]GJQ50991.1 MAG: hypothetical protein HKUEN01_33770 [Candidatus Kuenenia stuttgartiensis]
MELILYEENWLNIPLQGVTEGSGEKVADASFYNSFYKTFIEKDAKLEQGWVEYKMAVSDWIEKTILAQAQHAVKSPLKILSLGVGTGLIEKEWISKGYDVHLQECQETSLEIIKNCYPEIKTYICDARSIPSADSTYHVVVFVTLDYVFDRKGYTELLQEIKRLLCPGGTTVCYCVSNMTYKTILSSIKRKIFLKKSGGIPWGYARTVREHIRLGTCVGLIPQKIYLLEREIKSDKGSLILKSMRKPGGFWKRPSNVSDIVVEFSKPAM